MERVKLPVFSNHPEPCGIVQKDSVPVSDILQVWLDVSQHPARGKEQADLIWRKILSPAFESSEP